MCGFATIVLSFSHPPILLKVYFYSSPLLIYLFIYLSIYLFLRKHVSTYKIAVSTPQSLSLACERYPGAIDVRLWRTSLRLLEEILYAPRK